jgi:anti-sigma B factor antagonist
MLGAKGPSMGHDRAGSQAGVQPSLRTFVERSADSTLVRVGGEVDLATEPELHALLRSLDGDVVVDLARVTLLDACGIGAFVVERRRLTEGGGTLVLRAPAPLIRHVLGIVDLAEWIVD